MKTIADFCEAGARACGPLTPEEEAHYAEMRRRELAGEPLVPPQVSPARSSAAQRRAHEARLDDAIPGGSHDPAGIAARRRPRATRPRESARYQRHLGELGRRGARACRPQDVPRRVWGVIGSIQADPSGRAGARILEELPPAYAFRVYRAATVGGRPLSQVGARTTISLAWFFWIMGRDTKRRGFARVSDAIPMGTLRAVIRNPVTGQPYSRAGLCATSWGRSRKADHHAGALTRLRRAGALLRIQPPAGLVPLALVGPSGYAFAQTWISVDAAYGEPPHNGAQAPP